MTEPTTINRILTVPLTGDLVGSWGTSALNPNFNILDGLLGGVVNLALTSGTTTLTTPSGTPSPGAGPNQSSNALIRFSGTLTGNSQIVFTLPGFYIIENLCSGNATSYVKLCPLNGTGNVIGAPPGQKQYVFFDGTHMDYVDLPPVGTYLDLAVTTTPLWMTACTLQPWLPCIGTAYSTTTYSNLFNLIGGALGSATPDLQNRYRIPLDFTGTGRITSAGSGINGTTFGSAGGNQAITAHNHSFTGTQQTWSSNQNNVNFGGTSLASGSGNNVPTSEGFVTMTITPSGMIGTTGSGSSGNIPPALVAGMTFIKT